MRIKEQYIYVLQYTIESPSNKLLWNARNGILVLTFNAYTFRAH